MVFGSAMVFGWGMHRFCQLPSRTPPTVVTGRHSERSPVRNNDETGPAYGPRDEPARHRCRDEGEHVAVARGGGPARCAAGRRRRPAPARGRRGAAAGDDRPARGLGPAPGGRSRRPGPARDVVGPGQRRHQHPGCRRRRAAPLPGPVGGAVAGRAGPGPRDDGALRRRGRARPPGPPRRGPAAPRPATRSTCTSCGCGAASRRWGSRCGPSGRAATCCRPTTGWAAPPTDGARSRRLDRPGRATLSTVRLGIDTGGTFTDLVTDDGRVLKVSSTADDPGRALRSAIAASGAETPTLLAHGTTVATNALLQARGGRVALVTTARLRRRDRDRPPGPPVALRPVAGPPGAVGPARPAARGRGPARRPRDGARGLRPRRRPVGPRRCRRGRGVPAALGSRARARAGGRARAAPSRARRDVLPRGLARVPRVRAHGHDGRQRAAARRVPRVPRCPSFPSPARCS